MPIPYTALTNLAEVYLEDSYVLDIIETDSSVSFALDAVLTKRSSHYSPRHLGEQYCYATGQLTFVDVNSVNWITRSLQAAKDPDGTIDYGNIDTLAANEDTYALAGDWGYVRITAAIPPRFIYN